MKIAVWRTGHEIADTVAEAVYEGLRHQHTVQIQATNGRMDGSNRAFDLHCGYGILRGCGEVYKKAEQAKIPWIQIDKGYWKPGHYDGYYRISLRGTQQTFGLDKLKPDYERWDALGLEILPAKDPRNSALLCPPTDYVCEWNNIDGLEWAARNHIVQKLESNSIEYRHKGTETPIDWDAIGKIVTFNSSVGWEALRQGIPVVSNPTHSIVGAYQKMLDKDLLKDSKCRRDLFALMAGLQLRLDEIKSGALWPLLQTLLTTN